MSGEVGTYSGRWFELFAATIDPAQTERETRFLMGQLPLPRCRRVLDICCGNGRHAALLAERGYELTCIDISELALNKARARLGARAAILHHDMRQIEQLPGMFDAAMLLWQSFGQFDDATNGDVLRQIAQKLAPGGRLILDLYHREFFAARLGTRQHEKLGRTIIETKTMNGNRLTVRLDYGDGTGDGFEWRLYTPAEIEQIARACGFELLGAVSEYDTGISPSSERPRVQYVLEKR